VRQRRYRSLLDASDAAPRSLRHRSGGEADLALLKASLRAAGVFAPCPGYCWRKFAELFALWSVSAGALLAARHSPWVLVVAPLWSLATAQTVLFAHDAVHGNAFAARGLARRWVPHLLIGGLCGGSTSWWKQSHDRHHTMSNDPGLDPDIDYPFLAFDLAQAREKAPMFHPMLRHQHLLIWFLLPGAALTMRLYSVIYLLRRLKSAAAAERQRRHGFELGLLLAHWAAYLSLVGVLLPPHFAIAFVALHQAGFGTYLALITATNHWAMPMPDAQHHTFIEHQVMTSRNIRGGRLVRFGYGGLNTQIEHHLFVGLPRPRQFQARAVVRAFCLERGVPYVEQTPAEALRSIYGCLRSVAQEVRASESVWVKESD
jgi:fatty acid desaturase